MILIIRKVRYVSLSTLMDGGNFRCLEDIAYNDGGTASESAFAKMENNLRNLK